MEPTDGFSFPPDDEAFEWDPSKSTVTAWSVANTHRRAYGRRGSNKSVRPAGAGNGNTRSIQRTRQSQTNNRAGFDDDEPSFEQPGNQQNRSIEWVSATSNASFDFNRSETIDQPPPPPRPLGRQSRSKSVTLGQQRPPLLRQSRSVSSSSRRESLRSSTSSSNSFESRNEQSENAQPNVAFQEDENYSPFMSPQPPTKLKKIDMTPCDIETKGSKRKKLRQYNSETDLSDSSPSFMSPTQNSFRRLAQSAESAAAWVKLPDLSPGVKGTIGFDMGYLGDINAGSPGLSVATNGSRKRGVCELPDDDNEAFSLNGGNSFSYMSSPSVSTRSRSRSRIFSNGSFTQGVPASDSPAPSELFVRTGTDDDSMDEESDEASDGNEPDDESDGSASDGNMDFELEEPKAASLMPPNSVRRTSSDNFDASVFGDKTKDDEPPDATSRVFDEMSSYEDLKFLIKALRKEKHGSTISAFGTRNTWTIAPPSVWNSRRRAAFLQWTSRCLGFSLRAGGGAVAFLQIPVSKGGGVLEELEAALISHKAKDQPVQTASQLPATDIPSLVVPVAYPSRKTSRQTGRPSLSDGVVDMDLLHDMESLTVAQTKESDQDTKPASKSSEAPLVRIVTMDTNTSSHPPPGQISNGVLLKNVMEEQTGDMALNDQPPRLSGEHHVAGQDLVSHLHGLSPNEAMGPSKFPLCRMPRIPVAAIAEASPYVQATNNGCRSGARKSNVPFDEDEFIETPQVKRGSLFWGSGTHGGRDWGASKGCSKVIIRACLRTLEAACKEAGHHIDSPFEAVEKVLNRSPAGGMLPSGIASAVVSSAALGFDDFDGDENADNVDALPTFNHHRQSSVGATAMAGLNLGEALEESKAKMKRMRSFAKYRRISLCAAVLPPVGHLPTRRKTAFVGGVDSYSPRSSLRPLSIAGSEHWVPTIPEATTDSCVATVLKHPVLLSSIFSYLTEGELLSRAQPVSTTWADAATEAHATLMLVSVGCTELTSEDSFVDDGGDSDQDMELTYSSVSNSVAQSMERSWDFLMARFPWACFLSEGGCKRVYKAYNSTAQSVEAVSVMDMYSAEMKVVGAELAVSVMLSSLVRRNICPNFVITRGVFTCPYEPPAASWGSSDNRKPRGGWYDPRRLRGRRRPKTPSAKNQGNFQYIRMELCSKGDVEEFIKELPDQAMAPEESRGLLFQIAFALHVAADKFCLKHYDVKLLNIFLQDVPKASASATSSGYSVLRYGLGAHVFALRMPDERALLAKLADYGTANVQADSNGQPVTMAQFTTVENTPADYLIEGDSAAQGHGHDSFGLGLCMLHLFTGHAPYEEILEDVFCPPALKKKLRQIWQEDEYSGFTVVRSLILSDVCDEEDEPDETLYHTLYRYLVLFGIPEERGQSKVWKAITQTLEGSDRSRAKAYGRNARQGKKDGPDSAQFARDRKKYSLSHGNNKYIARARRSLEMMEGGLEILLSLVNFDAQKRATPLDVLNSTLMLPLREESNIMPSDPNDNELSFMAYATR